MAQARHVMWDMGGTLMDTYPSIDALLCERARAARAAGSAPASPLNSDIARTAALLPDELALADISRLSRGGITRAIHVLAARYGIDAVEAAAAHEAMKQSWINTDTPPVMAGAHETLAAVRAAGGLNCVVTHRDRPSATLLLERSGLAVDALICQPDGYPRKPHPAMYEAMLQRCDISPCECLAVGDRAIDALAALRAGIAPALLLTPGLELGDPLLSATDRAAWSEATSAATIMAGLAEVPGLLASTA